MHANTDFIYPVQERGINSGLFIHDDKPSYLLLLLAISKLMSCVFAGLHSALIKAGALPVPAYFEKPSSVKPGTLQSVWYAKLVRRAVSFLVRTPAKRAILQLVDFDLPLPKNQGCIILTCHSPWKRLLVQWCLEKKFALLMGGGKWKDRRRRLIQRQGRGVAELRELVTHLKLGGRVIMKAEMFNHLNNCPVKFLQKDCNASLLAERLSILAKVPILTVVIKLAGNGVEISAGPQFSPNYANPGSPGIMPRVLAFFEKEIQKDPSILANYVK